jgi:hypothetical protein
MLTEVSQITYTVDASVAHCGWPDSWSVLFLRCRRTVNAVVQTVSNSITTGSNVLALKRCWLHVTTRWPIKALTHRTGLSLHGQKCYQHLSLETNTAGGVIEFDLFLVAFRPFQNFARLLVIKMIYIFIYCSYVFMTKLLFYLLILIHFIIRFGSMSFNASVFRSEVTAFVT